MFNNQNLEKGKTLEMAKIFSSYQRNVNFVEDSKLLRCKFKKGQAEDFIVLGCVLYQKRSYKTMLNAQCLKVLKST